ncbi:hypothetical protein L0P24_23495, partial [Phocaeicola vulgatus]|nr:hypothetical protein [Phocaeicola vulgatus]MCB6293701.1 hypothetical protein [Phocaeicola vulgatus]MCB6327459.1 hypothetical protein [Phocaeicola vulgatus]MCB6451109.1 hypothetical protein [Phocaeicola vulgatus]MCB7283964.1 hypothetical protein [Phocaeicola vulgatus]
RFCCLTFNLSVKIYRSIVKEKAANAVLIPIPAATRERNIARFARFCSFLSHRLKVVDGIRATRGWRALVSA